MRPQKDINLPIEIHQPGDSDERRGDLGNFISFGTRMTLV